MVDDASKMLDNFNNKFIDVLDMHAPVKHNGIDDNNRHPSEDNIFILKEDKVDSKKEQRNKPGDWIITGILSTSV